MSVVQVVVSGGALFLLYRYLLQTLGSRQLGVWAVVLAVSSVSRISEMGFSGSAVKFTAKYIARKENEKAANVVETTILSVGFALACVLIAGYPLAGWIMKWFVPAADSPAALSLLPYAWTSIWIGTVAAVSLSGLDGCQRIDLRAGVVMVSGVVFVCLTWALVPRFGLIGLGIAQIAQNSLVLLVSWTLLRREIPSLHLAPVVWRLNVFREMFSYGVNFQVSSIALLLLEPTTKALISKFGGLSMTGYFDMAYRFVMQCRGVLVSANQAIVPQVAVRHEISPGKLNGIYSGTYGIVLFLTLPVYAGMAASVPLLSILWIGHYERVFVFYTLLLTAGFGFNTLIGPAYYVNLGTGSLRWNTASHIIMGILNGALGFLLGTIFGGQGVVWGLALALVIGSSLVVIGHHRDNRIPFSALWPVESHRLLLACIAGLIASTALFLVSPFTNRGFIGASLSLAACILIVAPAMWSHSLRSPLWNKVAGTFGK
jgi:O-antigen/teichoic acid export membrane protein